MELLPYPEKDHSNGSHDLIEYTLRLLKPDTDHIELLDKECVVCGLIESGWNHYQLPCLHYGHTRCVRHWICTKGGLQCPWCQDSTPKDEYCDTCKKWTQINHNCPLMSDEYEFAQNIDKIRNSDYHDQSKKSKMITFLIRRQITYIDDIETLEMAYNLCHKKKTSSKKPQKI